MVSKYFFSDLKYTLLQILFSYLLFENDNKDPQVIA